MARADSTILVKVLGDAKGLQKELGGAEKALGGFGKAAGALAVGALAAVGTKELFDFAQGALAESDRLGDALGRLEGQIGGDLTQAVDALADDFTNLGQSRQDILELAAGFTDTAVALGQGAPDIAAWATDAAAIAAALELSGVGDAASNIDAIGKAAGGSERAMRELGLNLSDAEVEARALADTGKTNAEMLTEQEITGARYVLILEKLAARTGDLTASNGDLEQSQAEIQAKWETLTGKIGEGLEGPLNDLLGWVIEGIEGWEMFGEKLDFVRSELRKTLGPIYAVTDAVSTLLGALGDLLTADDFLTAPRSSGGFSSGGSGSSPGSSADRRTPARDVVVNVSGGDPYEVERAVSRAISGYTSRGGTTYPR